MKKLFFVRHGLSQANLNQQFAGHLETPLTDEGRHQAQQTGERLRERHIDLIITSPLQRAAETAAIIADVISYPREAIHQDPRVIERGLGELEGTAIMDFQLHHAYAEMEDVPGVESLEALHERALGVLRGIQKMPEDVILLVSHGAFGHMLRHIAYGEDYRSEYTRPVVPIRNGELIELL